MASIAKQDKRYTVDEYLALEIASDSHGDGRPSEFIAGVIRERPGKSLNFNRIKVNLVVLLDGPLKKNKDWDLEVFMCPMRLRLKPAGPFYYPDFLITPHPVEIDPDRGGSVLNPAAIIEISSPDTEFINYGEKLANYAQTQSLHNYIIISEEGIRVDYFTRTENGAWRGEILRSPSATLAPPGLPIAIPLAEIYEDVEFDPP